MKIDYSIPITREAYDRMCTQRDKFRDECARLRVYERNWNAMPARCRRGFCCTQDAETRANCGCPDVDDDSGCGVPNCPNGPDCPA